jgi:hypothetical protein
MIAPAQTSARYSAAISNSRGTSYGQTSARQPAPSQLAVVDRA